MTDNNPTDKDDIAWQEVVKGIKPINSSKVVTPRKKKYLSSKEKDISVPLKIYRHNLSLGTTADIDRCTMRRFKREDLLLHLICPVKGAF